MLKTPAEIAAEIINDTDVSEFGDGCDLWEHVAQKVGEQVEVSPADSEAIADLCDAAFFFPVVFGK